MSNADDPLAWLATAHEDLLAIDNNLASSRIPWGVVGFHAQQAAEKTLKALLVSRGRKVPFIHDLGLLLRQCIATGAALKHFEDDCDLLTPYAVANRYPDVGPDPTEAESRMAVAAARRIVAAVRPLIGP
jgi:HEPN domain-containing protein